MRSKPVQSTRAVEEDSPTHKKNTVSNQSWALVSELIVTVTGLVSFVQLTVYLSAADFGILASVQAIARTGVALAVFGAPSTLIRRVSQGRPKQDSWRRAVTLWYGGAGVVALLIIALKPVLLQPASYGTFILLVLSYTILSSHGELIFTMATATGDMKLGAMSRLVVMIPRLAALGLYGLFGGDRLVDWAIFALVAHLFGNLAAWFHGQRTLRLSSKPLNARILPGEARQGLGFAMSGLSAGVLDASDRPILVNNDFKDDAGYYSIGARIVAFALAPTLALMRATTSEVFGSGADGLRSSVRATVKWLPAAILLNCVIGIALYLCAPAVMWVLSDDYSTVPTIIRLLAWFPLIRSVQYMAGNALDAAGFQYQRFTFTVAAAVLNFGLNLWLIPRFGWKAAVGTTMASEVALLIALAGFALIGARRDFEPRPA